MPTHESEAAITLFQGVADKLPEIFRWQAPDDQLDRMLVVAAQGHAFFERNHFTVDAGLLKSFFQRPGKYFLMKSLAPEDLRCKHVGRFFRVAFADLFDDGGPGLGGQPASASRTMLGAQFAE